MISAGERPQAARLLRSWVRNTYRAVLWKTVCWDINDNLPHPVSCRLFYCGVSPLWCKWCTFFVLCRDVVIFHLWGHWKKLCWICNYIEKYIYFIMVYGLLSCLYVWCVVALLTFWNILSECVSSCLVLCIFHVHVQYIWFYSQMKILYMFVFVLITFYKALGLYSHVDRYCSLYVLHLMCVVYVLLYCDQNDDFSPHLHCTVWLLEDYWLQTLFVYH